jgi:hypothetical protein
MSLIKTTKAQLGLSVTPTNNFTLDASADNGTMKLARGNAGATTQDILTVDAAGKLAFPAQGQTLAANGYVRLPGGLIVQWGTAVTSSSSDFEVTHPIPFPTANLAGFVCADTPSAAYGMRSAANLSSTTFVFRNNTGAGAGVGITFKWLAIGY